MKSIATAARAYAAQVLRLDADRAGSLSVDKLSGGERHQLFRVSELGSESYVVRINNTHDQYDLEKARREAMVLSYLEDGLAPRLYDYDECSTFFHRPTMLIAFLPGMLRFSASTRIVLARCPSTSSAEVNVTNCSGFPNWEVKATWSG